MKSDNPNPEQEKFEANLTAYALGELGPEEHAEMERALVGNDQLKQEVEEIRTLAKKLETELQSTVGDKLSAEQRTKIEAAVRPSYGVMPRGRVFVWGALLALAACVALAMVVSVRSYKQPRPVALAKLEAPSYNHKNSPKDAAPKLAILDKSETVSQPSITGGITPSAPAAAAPNPTLTTSDRLLEPQSQLAFASVEGTKAKAAIGMAKSDGSTVLAMRARKEIASTESKSNADADERTVMNAPGFASVDSRLLAKQNGPRKPTVPPPQIVIPNSREAGKPMELRELNVQARIVGLAVETTTTMTFFNPNHRRLEGELQFPLPDGAVITGYALDIGGQMIEGVVVKKEKARVAFETEVRRGVDPGIVEHVAGNVYRTRIYPLPENGTRKVQIKYIAELVSDNNGDVAWSCPMPIGETVAKLGIRVEVAQSSVKPEIGGFGNLHFKNFDNLWVAETVINDAKPGEDLWVALPKLPSQNIAVERVDNGDDFFFMLSDLPQPVASALTKTPRKLGIAWDASGSRSPDNIQKEIAMLKAVLGRLKAETVLLVFRDKPEELRALGDPETLRDLPYDGGTDLTALAAAMKKSDVDHWLLFTDGLDTLSEKLPDFDKGLVTAVVSQTIAHREYLRQACSDLIDLQRLDINAGVDAILQAPAYISRVLGSGIAEVQGVGARAQGRVSVCGKLIADTAELRLEYSDGHQSAPFRLNKKTATSGKLLAGAWAARRVTQLAVRAESNEDELLALGRQYGIVSPVTSLIVLENLDQYLRNDIEPPASLPDMRRQWQTQKTAQAKAEQQKRASKIDHILELWKNRVSWWEKTVTVAPGFKYQGEPGNAPNSPHPGRVSRSRASVIAGAATNTQTNGDSASAAITLDDSMIEPARAPQLAASVPTPATPIPFSSELKAEDGEGRRGYLNKEKAVNEPGNKEAIITIKPWNPATPYLAALKAASKADRYKVYLNQRKSFAASPAFFVDCSEFFMREGDPAIGERVLTNLAELKLEEASLLRVLAWRLQQAGALERAIVILRRVEKLRPEEPQSYRDLALALAENGKTEEAMDLFLKVVMGEWQRFDEIELIALEELNALMARTGARPPASMDSRLVKNLDVDVRIVMVWDADATDVDLHVQEPTGEEAAYNHNRTTIGGLVSRDFTQGYGPEEYMVRRAQPGIYKIFAHYYGSQQQTVTGPCTITATVFTNFGRPTQKKQVLTLRLDKPNDKVDVGEIKWDDGKNTSVKVGERPETEQGLSRDTLRLVSVGQSKEDVKNLLGDPKSKQEGLWIYCVKEREYRIRFSDKQRVRSVIEVLPGGAEMILVQ